MPSKYPIAHPGADDRWSWALLHDIGAVLVAHGYPDPRRCARDSSRLQLALFRFVYSLKARGARR